MSKGFVHNPLADINLIRDILRDRYHKGFPILKELIQNADDAGATQLDIGRCYGLPQADHPLLGGPAMFVANDGPFRYEDARSIRQMGLSDRAAEQSTVGKFGLGLKSVFHLCEAFFYLASAPPEGTNQAISLPRDDVLNPWSGDPDVPIHANWDTFSESARQAIVGRLRTVLTYDPWFCLWIPLRRRAHLDGIDPIIPEFPGDGANLADFLEGVGLSTEIPDLLPMLVSLRTIRFWQYSTRGIPQDPTMHFTRVGCGRSWTSVNALPSDIGRFGSEVTITASRHVLAPRRFAGIEALLDSPTLRRIQELDAWPKLSTVNRTTCRPEPASEKAKPHCAAYFIRHPQSGEPSLSISHAVFLPVSDPSEHPSIIGKDGGTWDYHLVLHGYYFLDSGRSHLDLATLGEQDRPDDERGIQRRWNSTLYREGVLPLILPALEQFVTSAKLERRDIERLTAALQRSTLFGEHKQQICSRLQWLARFPEDVWQLHAVTQQVFELPAPPQADRERPSTVFPALNAICKDHLVSVADQPCLRANDRADTWPADLVERLLSIPVADVFGNEGNLGYLVEFLESLPKAVASSPLIARRLLEISRQAFSHVPLRRLRAHRAVVQRCLRFVPVERRLAIGNESPGDADSLLETLLRLDLAVLLVPREFDPDKPGEVLDNLTIEDAAKVLAAVADSDLGWATGAARNIRLTVALQIVAAAGEQKTELLRRCGAFKLFFGSDCSLSRQVDLSMQEMTECLTLGTLFVQNPSPAVRELADDLQRALHGGRVLVVESEITKALFDSPIKSCTVESCIQLLRTGAALAGADQRMALLRKLTTGGRSAYSGELRTAVRYLLHGDSAHIGASGPLLIEETAVGKGAWSKLARVLLRGSQGGWRLVPRNLGDVIARADWAEIELDDVRRDSVARLLSDANVDALDCSSLTADDRAVILAQVEDTNVLKRLPIHETLDHLLVAVKADTYLDGGFLPEPGIFPGLTVIAKHRDPTVVGKQRQLMPTLDAEAAIAIVLRQEQPSLHWQRILQALDDIFRGDRRLEPLLEQDLKAKKWLPLDRDSAVAPGDVIYLPGLEDEVAPVVAMSQGAFLDVLRLPETVRIHGMFSLLVQNRILPDVADALTMLGALMAEREEFRIGPLGENVFDLDTFLEAFRDAPRHLMASFPLVEGVARQYSPATCTDSLIPQLRDPMARISGSRVAGILHHLASAHAAGGRRAEKLLKVHNWYLAVAARLTDAEFRPILMEHSLLSAAGRWKTTSQLCLEYEGVDDDDILDADQVRIIRAGVPTLVDSEPIKEAGGPQRALVRAQGDWDLEFEQSAARLRTYFAPWQGAVAQETIGGFLAMLGDHPEIRVLTEHYLGNRTVPRTRELFEWAPIGRAGVGGAGKSVHEAMDKQRFVVKVIATETVTVPNLIGGTFAARIGQNVRHLVVGNLFWGSDQTAAGLPVKTLTLLRIDPTAYSEERLAAFLRLSAAVVLKDVYSQGLQDLEGMWQELRQSEQLDIEVAQRLLIDGAFYYLRQNGVRSHPSINQIFSKWDQARRLEAEETQAERLGRGSRGKQARDELAEASTRLEKLLNEDDTAREAILASVRTRMQDHYQYQPGSAPFELFQNADDAAVELAEMLGEDGQAQPLSPRFVVASSATSLTFLHWGRRINQFMAQRFDGRERGFDRDLEKMLVLSDSDKQPTDDAITSVTGRFGLGFKSVYFITDAPRILSGRLCFKVVGGFMPQRLTGDDVTRLENYCRHLELPVREATVIDLPFRSPPSANEDTVLGEFKAWAHILVGFARRIKRVEFYGDGAQTGQAVWVEEPLRGVPGAGIVELRPLGDASDKGGRGLVLRCHAGAILLSLGPRAFGKLPKEMPTIWVTAPTKEAKDVGFAVNGPFAVDVGRSQLARESGTNARRARSLGTQCGEILICLARAAASWDSLRDALGLAKDAEPYGFWESLWEILAAAFHHKVENAGDDGAIDLVRQLLWDADRGAATLLFSTQPVLPTQLYADYRSLTKLKDIRFAATGSLDTEPVFAQVSDWPAFRRLVAPGAIISSREVLDPLRRLCPDHIHSSIGELS